MIDFLVIGAGIAGISAAARLSHLGSVTVLEAEDGLGYHTSGRSAAVFDMAYGLASTKVLNRISRDYHMTKNGGVLSPLGMMLVGGKQDGKAFADDLVAMQMQTIPVLDAIDMVPILNPDVVTQVGFNPDAWNIDTDLLMQNFAREVRSNGGSVLTGQRVQKIDRTPAGWHITTSDTTYDATVLVNAAGSWVDQIAVMAGVKPLGFTPYRRSIARIPAPGGHDMGQWPMMHGSACSWYAKPDAGSLLVSPSEEHASKPHDAWPDDLVLAEGLARYEAMVTQPVTRLESSWAGLRTFSPDRALVLGPDNADNSFVWVAGQCGVGFQTCPAASQLVSDLVAGAHSEIPAETIAALSPSRYS